ncbi:MAG: tyrosine-type recombinase/integrase [Planctomycetaceae bacterium]
MFTRDGLTRRRRAGVPKAFDANSYQQQIRKATRRAGCEHWHPHRLRHSYATRVRAEEGIEVAQSLLGQSCLSSTEIYAEVDIARAEQVVERLG